MITAKEAREYLLDSVAADPITSVMLEELEDAIFKTIIDGSRTVMLECEEVREGFFLYLEERLGYKVTQSEVDGSKYYIRF